MVRLKGTMCLSKKSFGTPFQFLYGAIKSDEQAAEEERQRHFNSSMVRLKDEGDHFQHGTKKFQFLYGAIKRRHGKVSFKTRDRFQFLYGAIKREQTM